MYALKVFTTILTEKALKFKLLKADNVWGKKHPKGNTEHSDEI